MSFVSEPVFMLRCLVVETWFQGSESLLKNFIFRRNTGSQRAAAWRDGAQSETPDEETTCVSTPCDLIFISRFLNVSLSVFHTRGSLFLSGFSHSPYLQENTWIHAATLEFNGLRMNLEWSNIEILVWFYVNYVALMSVFYFSVAYPACFAFA